MRKLSLHVGDKGRPFASQLLAPSGQLEPNGTIFGPNQYFVRGGSGVFEIAFAIGFSGLAWLGLILREPRLLWTILLRQ